jgi:hypothetical protein
MYIEIVLSRWKNFHAKDLVMICLVEFCDIPINT